MYSIRINTGNIYRFVNNKYEPLPFIDGWMDCAKSDLLAVCAFGIGKHKRSGATVLR